MITTDNFTFDSLATARERTPGELTAVRRAHVINGGNVILLARTKLTQTPAAVITFYGYDQRKKSAYISVHDLLKERGGAAMKAGAEIGTLSITGVVPPMVTLNELFGEVSVTRAEALKAPARNDPALKDPAILRGMLVSNVTLDGLVDLPVMTANLNTEVNQRVPIDAALRHNILFRFTKRP